MEAANRMDTSALSVETANDGFAEAGYSAAPRRRDSWVHASGLGGVSWGSVAIGSWLKDEVMFHATLQHSRAENAAAGVGASTAGTGAESARRRPSLTYSTSPNAAAAIAANTAFLPHLEQQYCKDYSCCGISLPDLHDLLRHYEEVHIVANRGPTSRNTASVSGLPHTHIIQQQLGGPRTGEPSRTVSSGVASAAAALGSHGATIGHSGLAVVHTPALHLNGSLVDAVSTNDVFLHHSNTRQDKNYGKSHSKATSRQNSLLKPPDMGDLHSQIFSMDLDHQGFVSMDFLNSNSDNGVAHNGASGHVSPKTIREVEEELEEDNASNPTRRNKVKNQKCIDDPARRLYVMDHEEDKPFRCPVIGCDKAYKNQNGLKYHRLHGHQNQKLVENPDGTISVQDPDSGEFGVDGLNSAKDKPYRCEVCGKRYKNLNGLKYHRGHSTH